MSLVSEAILETFHDSLERCRDRTDFFNLFYDRFLASDGEISVFFEGKDLARIIKMVKDALYLIMMASDTSSFAAKKIERLGEFHSAFGIKAEHYDHWLSALLSTVEEADPHFSQDVADAWVKVMGVGIEIMKRQTKSKLSQHVG
ncbi:MAG: globin [Bdellovibrionales bacterium]|nr:globin [Bdellovibrionales bacterium]